MAETPLKVRAAWEGELEAAYQAAVERWLAEPEAAGALAVYRDAAFPLGCERIRRMRQDVPPLDLLFVPVGTQPYAPALAILGNPAACVALLETAESRSYGLEVEAALGGEGGPSFVHVAIEPTDVLDIGRKMKDVYDARGLPSGARVGADVTGGRKPMTAAVAGVGSLFRWRLFYVDGLQERHRAGYAHHERIIELPNVLDAFGRRRRETALELLAAGACVAACRLLAALCRSSAASGGDRRLLRFARAAAHLRAGRVAVLARKAVAAARGVGRPLGAKAASLLAAALGAGAESDAAQGAVLWVAARVRQREGDELGARSLMIEAALSMEADPPGPREPLAEAGARLGAVLEEAGLAEACRELDGRLGRGVRRVASRRG